MKTFKSSSVNAGLSNQQLHARIDQLTEQVSSLEHPLLQDNDRLNTLSSALKLGFWEWDEIEGRATFYSKEVAAIFGVSLDVLKAKFEKLDGFFDCIHPDDLDHYKKSNQVATVELISPNHAHIYEYRIIWPNGEIRQLRELYNLIYDKKGVVTNTFGAIQDITEHQQSLTALKQSEGRYSSLFTQLPIGVQECDYSYVKKGVDKLRNQGVGDLNGYFATNPKLLRKLVDGIRTTRANNALVEIHGADSIKEFLKTEEDISIWWNDQWAKYYVAEIEAFSGPRKIYEAEGIDTRIDSSEFDMRLVSSVVSGHEDTWERVIVIIEDITERKRTESDLIEARDTAEKANNAKSDFLSSMSHELRTPLNAILGFSQLFEYDKSLSERGKSYARDINSAGEHLLNLIGDILDLSQIETGPVDLPMEAVSLEAVINESLTWVADMAASRGVTIDFDPTRCRGLFIKADAIRLKQVFLNILTNSVKYNCDKGRVNITCTRNENNLVSIIISDTGIGIPQDRLSELFQPFNRLGAEHGAIEGTGIGLVITRQLMQLMQGEIKVESAPGKGSKFTLQFQAIDEEASVGVTTDRVLSSNATSRVSVNRQPILVAEDNPLNRELLSAQLELLGYTADFTENGVEALKLWKTGEYKLLLTDILMPEMDGYELIRAVRALESNAKTSPIIAVTANAMPKDIKHCLEIGANDVLPKPVSLQVLKQMLEMWGN